MKELIKYLIELYKYRRRVIRLIKVVRRYDHHNSAVIIEELRNILDFNRNPLKITKLIEYYDPEWDSFSYGFQYESESYNILSYGLVLRFPYKYSSFKNIIEDGHSYYAKEFCELMQIEFIPFTRN